MSKRKPDIERVADIVRDAGGKIVGRTRLQKIGYILELAGLGDGFRFEYRHYGPYSEELAVAARNAHLFGVLKEAEHPTSWGGTYSVYTTSAPSECKNLVRFELVRLAAEADPIELELAATAAFLAQDGVKDPWDETARRKPEKVQGEQLSNAKLLYRRLSKLKVPNRLPRI